MIGRATNKHYLLFTGGERFRSATLAIERDDDHRHRARRRPGPAHGRRRQGAASSSRGKPMVAHVLDRLAPQVGDVLINANQNAERYAAFGHPVVADAVGGFAGPARRPARGHDRRDDALRRHRALRLAVPARRPRRAARARRSSATARSSRSRARSTSRIRCSRSCAATCCRISRPSSPAAGARSTRGTRRFGVVEVAVRRRRRGVSQHQHARSKLGRDEPGDLASDRRRAAVRHPLAPIPP